MTSDPIRQRTCGDKTIWRSRRRAARVADAQTQACGDLIRAYRCPFCSKPGRPRYHIGHVPSMESLEALAEAIRDHPAAGGP